MNGTRSIPYDTFPGGGETIRNYIETGVPTGDFMRYVISNDLKGSFGHADEFNLEHLFDIVMWMYQHAPGPCWGSPEAYTAWLEHRGLSGYTP